MSPRTPDTGRAFLAWRAYALLCAAVLAWGGAVVIAQGPPQPAREAKTAEQVRYERARETSDAAWDTRWADAAAAWRRWVEARRDDLREGRMVAVVGKRGIVFLSRAQLSRSLLQWTSVRIAEDASQSGDVGALRSLADAELLKSIVRSLEEDALRESEEYRQKLEASLPVARAEEARLREEAAQHWARVRTLELREAELQRAGRGEAGTGPRLPADPRGEIEGLSSAKRAAGEWLDQVRKEGNWSADHHFRAGMLIGFAATRSELAAVTDLIKEYQGCYATKNTEQAAVAANARAGKYPTPGDRIGELNKIAEAFNQCIARADRTFERARGR